MAKVSPIITNFTAGEIDPRVFGRVDIKKYFSGAAELENMTIADFGSASFRVGSYFAAEVKDSTKATRLIEFQFNTEQAYILEMGEEYFRFYTDQGQIIKTLADTDDWVTSTSYVVGDYAESGSAVYYCLVAHTSGTFSTDLAAGRWVAQTIYEVPHPYQEDELFDVQYAQTNDVIYLCHPNHAPRKMSRTGNAAWTIETVVFEGGPFLPVNKDEDHTMNPSATTGDITVTSSEAYFTSDMVGMFMRIAGTVEVDSVDVQGYVIINSLNASTPSLIANCTVQKTLSSAAATDDWALGAWGEETGYPSCVGFYEQRSVFANTPNSKPQTTWLSVTEQYENFTNGSDDADGMTWTIAAGQVNSIRWISAAKVLGLGTSGGVFSLSSGSEQNPLTPSNVVVQLETRFGVSKVHPRQIDNYTYYIQRNNRLMREFAYEFMVDTFNAKDMTLIASHILGDTVVDMDYQQSPHNMIWCVRDDGEIATMTRQVDQEVIAWARIVTNGEYESVAVIPQDSDGYDEVWTIVKRSVNGADVRYVEYFKSEDWGDDQEDCFFVDCGLTYDSTATTTISGLDHLEGETVTILADGATHPTKVVSSGAITLDRSVSVVQVGLGYTGTIKTLNLEAGSATGTAQGKTKRVYKATIRFFETLGAKIGWAGKMDTIPFRTTSDDMDAPPALFTGDKAVAFPKGWGKNAQITIIQDQPLPMTVLAIMPLMTTVDA